MAYNEIRSRQGPDHKGPKSLESHRKEAEFYFNSFIVLIDFKFFFPPNVSENHKKIVVYLIITF